MALSTQLAAATRRLIAGAKRGVYASPELRLVRPLLELQRRWSALPGDNEWLVERIATREGHGLFFYPFEGRLAHLGLATLFSYRLSREAPRTFSLTANDYGFGLLSPRPVPLGIADLGRLLAAPNVEADILAGLNAAELGAPPVPRDRARRRPHLPGLSRRAAIRRGSCRRRPRCSTTCSPNTTPDNLLLRQAVREVLERQLEAPRIATALARLRGSRALLTRPARPTPFAFPLLVEMFRDELSTEALRDARRAAWSRRSKRLPRRSRERPRIPLSSTFRPTGTEPMPMPGLRSHRQGRARHRRVSRPRLRDREGPRAGRRDRRPQRPPAGGARGRGEGADRRRAPRDHRRVRRDRPRRDRAAASPASSSRYGQLDILVNNAGIQRRNPLVDFTQKDWDDVIATNLTAPFLVSQAALPGMIARKAGKIIHIASLMSDLARPTVVPYTAAKGGVRQLTRGMAVELAPHNIQVNAIAPGYFATEMNRALIDNPEFDAWVKKRTPAGRWGQPDEIAGLAVFLASSAADYITGQLLVIDGGMSVAL